MNEIGFRMSSASLLQSCSLISTLMLLLVGIGLIGLVGIFHMAGLQSLAVIGAKLLLSIF